MPTKELEIDILQEHAVRGPGDMNFMPKCRRVPGFKVRLSMALGSGLVDNVPAHCRGVELDEFYKAYDKAKTSYDSVSNFINQHLKFSLNNL